MIELLQNLVLYGLEHFKLYYGLYRAQVVDTSDPLKRGRILILCPAVGHTLPPPIWVEPAFQGAGSNRGSFWPPEVGDSVRVSFQFGKPDKPQLYFGGWYGDKDLPEELGHDKNLPRRRGFVTKAGHTFIVNDDPSNEAIELIWHKPSSQPSGTDSAKRTGDKAWVKFKKDGTIELRNKNDSKLVLDATGKKILVHDQHGNELTLHDGGIDLDTKGTVTIKNAKLVDAKSSLVKLADGADTPAVRGKDLVTLFATHNHGCAVGPTTPPLNAAQAPTILSKNVTLK